MMNTRPLSGFLFSFVAILMWGTLPIALQPVLALMNAQTVVWFRFVVAMCGVFCLLFFAKKLPKLTACTRQDVALIALGIAGLSLNFFLFNVALRYIPATASQVLSPISSFAMLLCGVLLFKETIGIHQKIGALLLAVGFPLFFNDRFGDFAQMNGYAFGILCGMLASLCWLGYGIAQKIMLKRFNSLQILLMIYIGCSLVFTPLIDLTQLKTLTPLALGCLIYCCLNTIIAYGCYAEALNRWEVSKVSVMMTQIPVLTILFSHLAYQLAPTEFAEPKMNGLSYLGAALVVLGAVSAAIGHKLFYASRFKKRN